MRDLATDTSQGDLADSEFKAIIALALTEAGLSIPDSKRALVQSRISKRMRILGIGHFKEYIDIVTDPENDVERRELVSALTTNVSSFYRERHHFEFLSGNVLPGLRTKLEAGGRGRFWSAGCSSGQEPYTLAIETLKAIPDIARHDFRILATDIDSEILNRAREATYSESDLAVLDVEDRNRFFSRATAAGSSFVANEALRSLVRFRQLNLHDHWPIKGTFDAIFCRNVVIYFGADHQAALWPRFRDALIPGGHFFLGHSERIHPIAGSGLSPAGVTIYRKDTDTTDSKSEHWKTKCH